MSREKQILNYNLCEQLKDQNIKMAKLVDKLVRLYIHKSWEEDSFSSQKLLYQNALNDLMSAQSSFNKVVCHVDWLLKGRRTHETDLFDRLEKSYNEDESSQIELLDAVKEILKFKKRKKEEEADGK
jgi:hypothetical protein